MQSELRICKPNTRSMATLVDHGNLSEFEARKILAGSLKGSFLIIDGLKEKQLMYRTDRHTFETEKAASVDFEKRKDLKRPILANPLIQRKSEAVNLLAQMIFITDPSKLAKLKDEVAQLKTSNHCTFTMNGHVFTLRRDINKHIEINKRCKEFKRGAFGILYDVESLNAKEKRAIKMAIENPLAKSLMKSEIELLEIVGGSEGIQKAPYAVIDYTDEHGVDHIGYLTIKYLTTSIDLMLELDTELQPELIRPLIVGLNKIHQEKIYHGDINPDNILYNFDETNLSIADFGGALKFEDKKKQFEEFVRKGDFSNVSQLFVPCRPNYVSYSIKNKLQESLLEISNMIELVDFDRHILPLLFANDEFSLGLTLFILLTASIPPFKCFKSQNEFLMAGQNDTDLEKLQAICVMREALTEKISDVDLVDEVMRLIVKGL